jgi:hypothetical protein
VELKTSRSHSQILGRRRAWDLPFRGTGRLWGYGGRIRFRQNHRRPGLGVGAFFPPAPGRPGNSLRGKIFWHWASGGFGSARRPDRHGVPDPIARWIPQAGGSQIEDSCGVIPGCLPKRPVGRDALRE